MPTILIPQIPFACLVGTMNHKTINERLLNPSVGIAPSMNLVESIPGVYSHTTAQAAAGAKPNRDPIENRPVDIQPVYIDSESVITKSEYVPIF